MTHIFRMLILVVVGALHAQGATDLASALREFAAYDYGRPQKVLHDTRLAAMRGTQDDAVRTRHERLLQEFVQSDASVFARRAACLWLSELGSASSRAVLDSLARQDAFADVARVALDSLEAAPRDAEGEAPTHALAVFKAAVPASAEQADLLTQAIGGRDEAVARLAFSLASQGIASRQVCEWLEREFDQLNEARQILAMNLLVRLNAAEGGRVIRAASRTGKGAVRFAAIEHLGRMGEGEDVAYLMGLLERDEGASANAARRAFIAMPSSSGPPELSERLLQADDALQATLIDLAVARNDSAAHAPLMSLAGRDGAVNQRAAIRALGKVGDVDAYPAILDALVAAEGGPLERDWQGAAWDMTRRQPDCGRAIGALEAAAQKAPQVAQELKAMGERRKAMNPKGDAMKSPVLHSNILLPGSFQSVIPKRYDVAAYLNCGPGRDSRGKGVTIVCSNGARYNSWAGTDASLSVLYARDALEFTVTGMKDGEDYVLGMTWWDSDLNGRRQSVWINGEEILPETPALAFGEGAAKPEHRFQGRPTPARIQFALLPEHIRGEACTVRVRKHAGPNAVTSEIWLLKREQPRAEKQVLLVSGQDYPGHHWRETGPVLADAIIRDPRMEVTICETPGVLGLVHLDAYDAVFMHFKNYRQDIPVTAVMKQRLTDYVKGGGGMCLSHFACGAFYQEWPEFVELSGRIWSGQGHDRRGPFTVKVVDQDHPVTRGLGERFETDDELYFCLTGDPDIHLLCNAMSKTRKADQPQAIIYESGKGRTFLCTLGHDVRAYEAEKVRQLYQQGTAWAAGLDAE